MDIYKRAGCCLEAGGGAFESRLKTYKRKQKLFGHALVIYFGSSHPLLK